MFTGTITAPDSIVNYRSVDGKTAEVTIIDTITGMHQTCLVDFNAFIHTMFLMNADHNDANTEIINLAYPIAEKFMDHFMAELRIIP